MREDIDELCGFEPINEVSENFIGMKPWGRMELVLSHWEAERALEPICYTPKEFERLDDHSLVREIKEKGLTL